MFNDEDKKIEEPIESSTQEDIQNSKSAESNSEKINNEEKEQSLNEDTVNEKMDAEEGENSIDVLQSLLEGLRQENIKVKDENEALKDRLARTAAEYENFRKRTVKEKEGIYTDACEDVLTQILPILDNLERAVSVDGNIDDLKKGIEMTLRQFNTSLEKLNVEEIESSGEFNPHLHNAVMHIDDEQYGKNQIVEVFQKGYKRGDKVLRYSMVKVAN
ncbi:nucleotide exchange factor GrpE [Clostridium sp. DJ247]|uniref:nucleotide exchange factor GrpE n=1 Tax=Clostridium sp. DJ247 TaxID=2726188 RepID=UPI001625BB4C|nr:nucleotide exchange factor GrpE [Clostridium sp. DJ247]MBC2579253.1 nucleotide exchange factor GrpE [Clostridium sp. DJ247]MBC2579296.1 nucleotide exchange factor GrpE [Clostridium sp. DJ247]